MTPQWFTFAEIPYDRMRQDDRYWLPAVLQNKTINALCIFHDDNERVKAFIEI